jgi:hypothetical protein
MPLYWLCYHHDDRISVVIEAGPSLVHARMRCSLAELDKGTFTEGHELDRKTEQPASRYVVRLGRALPVRRDKLPLVASTGGPGRLDDPLIRTM